MDLTVIKEGNGPNPVFIRDIFEPMSNDELVAEWGKEIGARTDSVTRDSLVQEMMERDIRPDAWIRGRDQETGIYPDVSDPDFAGRLLRKTEFASLASRASDEDTCSKSQRVFETTAVQRLVARFLHPSTPYRGLLLNHGVGVGKTCSAVTVAETFLEMLPTNTVYILAPHAIAEGFERTIFDPARLVPADKEHIKLTSERWTSPQCTGMTYPRLTGSASLDSREEIAKEVAKVTRRRYKILGYRAFANWVNGLLAKIPATVTGAARADEEKTIIMKFFSDHLIIIDEAHNLRDVEAGGLVDETDRVKVADAAEGKALTPVLKRIVSIAEGLRLMFMTATPMYDTAPEIVLLMNLLILNDSKDERDLLIMREIFNSDGTLTEDGGEQLSAAFRRYVSYMRGENPNTFPLRLNPPESAGAAFLSKYPTISISRREGAVKMTDADKRIMSELPLVVTNVGAGSRVGESLMRILERNASADRTGAIEISDFVLDQTMQMGNITYPNGLFGSDGWETYMKHETEQVGGKKVSRYSWNPPEEEKLEDIFSADGLASHAPKISTILRSIFASRGIAFIYSRYVKSGALPIAIALEMAGWCRVMADGTPAPLLKRAGDAPRRYKAYYILLTSDETLSPDFAGLLQYATTFTSEKEALEGTKVRAILGSQIAQEGLDLKCVRELHLLDGWYHLNRIEQIEGRGVRYCSHTAIPLTERNCMIYLHTVAVPKYETADLYAYRLAVRKAQPIGRVTRLMKRYAWDCMLNRDAILLTDLGTRRIVDSHGRVIEAYNLQDKPWTSFCDFSDKCEYICGARDIPAAEVGTDGSTYKDFDFRQRFLGKIKLLEGLFSEEDVAIPIEQLRVTVFRDMPWSMAAIGLRGILGIVRLRRTDGIYGTLILRNGYLLFQPDRVTDTEIPLALRYGRAYGRLPRSVVPQRLAIGAAEAPVLPTIATEVAEGEEAVEAPAVAVAAGDARERAMASLRGWHGVLREIVAGKPGRLDTRGLPEETFDGWRWIFAHFGTLPETAPIACQWWMDNIWTPEERAAVFADWTRRGLGRLEGDEKMYAEQYQPYELFTGPMSGYLVFDGELRTYCYFDGDAAPAICPSISLPDVAAVIGKPVNRKAETGAVFGFLVVKSGNVVFKTVDKEKGDLKGAECANTSNLKNHERRIKLIQDTIRGEFAAEDEVVMLLLDDDPDHKSTEKEKKARQEAVRRRFGKDLKVADVSLDIKHLSDLSLKQSCPYMEFLLRWMDRRRVSGQRWFLSVVQSARAGVKMT